MSIGNYNQNAITAIMLATLPNFAKKLNLYKLALKKLSHILRTYLFLSIN